MTPRVSSTRRNKEVRKGKKRAISEVNQQGTKQESTREPSSSLSPPPPEPTDLPKLKRSKKGDTRPCPVCLDDIPVRLLAQHVELELYRVDELLRTGLTNVVVESAEAGPSTTRRGAAVKARKNMKLRSSNDPNSLEQVEKSLKLICKNRKQRHTKLKEIIAQDEDEDDRPLADLRKGTTTTCPVCLAQVGGDQEFVDAHVDACLSDAQRQDVLREQREALARFGHGQDVDAWGDVEVNGETRIRLNNTAGLRGTGIEVRDRNQVDVDEEVDVDGDDEAVFGDAQFTERDVLVPTIGEGATGNEDLLVDVDGDEEIDADGEEGDSSASLRGLVAQGKVMSRRQVTNTDGVKTEMDEVIGLAENDRIHQAIQAARTSGSSSALVVALENKIRYLETTRVSSSTSSLCRICLDPYNEPTISTGCWHTCCRECWLRCLGSTKLCPICKRITGATELRRVYL